MSILFSRSRGPAAALILVFGALSAGSLGCFNEGRTTTIVSATRFEVTTGSVVLGARQLLVDTANGDVWILEGDRAPGAQWVLLARGPDDAREPETATVQVPIGEADELSDKLRDE